jgi:peptidoglycan pentaglycine glycine transferase (the first glycine)
VSGSGATGGAARGWRRSGVAERGEWDAAVKELNGGVHQSWAWGEWYRHWGFEVERIRVDGPQGTGLAQVLIWPHGPDAHLARGPILSGEDEAVVARELFAAVDEVCEGRQRPLTLTVEPPTPIPLGGGEQAAGFVRAAGRWCCSGRTVVVPLLDDEAMLRRMRKKTRQQVRGAKRRGVVVYSGRGEAGLATFYALVQDTGRRNEFPIEEPSYYEYFMRHLADEALLLLARTEGGVATGLIVTCFGNEAISHFGGSSTELRVPGVTAYLYFEAMRLARARGCTRFDMWGVPDEDPPPPDGAHPRGSRGGDWGGIHHFKAGFGGDLVRFPPPLERRYPRRPRRRWALWRRG